MCVKGIWMLHNYWCYSNKYFIFIIIIIVITNLTYYADLCWPIRLACNVDLFFTAMLTYYGDLSTCLTIDLLTLNWLWLSQARVSRLDFDQGQRSATITLRIQDNDIPEGEKSFSVELLNPTGGAAVGVGSTITITIQHSDQAFGVFQFAEFSLFRSVEEVGVDEEEGKAYSEVALKVNANYQGNVPFIVVSIVRI